MESDRACYRWVPLRSLFFPRRTHLDAVSEVRTLMRANAHRFVYTYRLEPISQSQLSHSLCRCPDPLSPPDLNPTLNLQPDPSPAQTRRDSTKRVINHTVPYCFPPPIRRGGNGMKRGRRCLLGDLVKFLTVSESIYVESGYR